MPHPTILDVAEKAGVGVGTVSRVLNNSPQVRPATRKRVLAAIKALNFKPNTGARQLPRKTRVQNIGVISVLVDYHSFAERLRGVQTALEASESNHELVLYNISSLESLAERVRSVAQTGAAEGLLIIDLDLTEEQMALLESAHVPVVGLNHFQEKGWPCIGTDNFRGGQLAVEYLLNLGHRRIAYVGDDFVDNFGSVTSFERYEGYRHALESSGVSVKSKYLGLGPHGYAAARAAAAELLRLPKPPTAIFAMSDLQALGCVDTIREAGLRIPDDISVIGYDNLEVSAFTGLTTVNQNLEMNGRIGAEYLLRLITGREAGLVPTMPPLEIISRQTTRALNGTGEGDC